MVIMLICLFVRTFVLNPVKLKAVGGCVALPCSPDWPSLFFLSLPPRLGQPNFWGVQPTTTVPQLFPFCSPRTSKTATGTAVWERRIRCSE